MGRGEAEALKRELNGPSLLLRATRWRLHDSLQGHVHVRRTLAQGSCLLHHDQGCAPNYRSAVSWRSGRFRRNLANIADGDGRFLITPAAEGSASPPPGFP